MLVHPSGTLQVPASAVTVGSFDGVRRGHQALIRGSRERNAKLEAPSVVDTLDLPPKAQSGGAPALYRGDDGTPR